MEIAAVIYKLRVDRYGMAERFADMLAADNSRFDRRKFMAAAIWGIEERGRDLTAARRARRGIVQSHGRREGAEANCNRRSTPSPV